MICRNYSPPKTYLRVLALFLILTLAGCFDDNNPGDLLSNSVIGTTLQSDIDTAISALSGSGLSGVTAAYTVDMHRVTYSTLDTAGQPITVSGLVAVPQKAPGVLSPLLSLQHGTIFLDSSAPSNSASAFHIAVIAASLGYVVAAPDYIGYGESASTLHPYIHADTLAQTTVDMIRATRTFLSNSSIPLNDQLFLAGYSEGGYATLAAQKKMEQQLSSEFTVTASIPGSGSYDMSTMALGIATSSTIPVPAYVGFVMKAYDSAYNLNKLNSYYIQAPYNDGRLDTLYDGTNSGSTINAQLSFTTTTLFNTTFLASYLVPGNETDLKAAFADNNIYNWAPTAPTRFFHGPNDATIPYVMMTSTAVAMGVAGSTSVTTVDCGVPSPNANHRYCYYPYFSDTLATYLGSGIANNL